MSGLLNGSGARMPIPALTSIRFLFALMVVATHFSGFHPNDLPLWMGPLGFAAVSWFFILSGFIMAYSFSNIVEEKSIGKYLVARFWRLWPVQMVTLGASCLLFEASSHLAVTQPGYLALSGSLLHAWTASPFASQAFNVPAWSISHEWFFYLVFPLIASRSWVWAVSIAMAGLLAALAWATALGCWGGPEIFQDGGDSYRPTCQSVLYYWPPARLWEFVAGVLLFRLSTSLRVQGDRAILQILFIVSAGVGFVVMQWMAYNLPLGFYTAIAFYWTSDVVVGLLLILGLSIPGPASRAISSRVLMFGGEISFSIYMTHMLVLRFMDENDIGAQASIWVQFLIVCVLSVLVSAAIFVVIESPSRRWLKRVLDQRRARPVEATAPPMR